MDGSLDHYWVFYQVARCRSITRASEVLFSSQPNVTHTIRVLEQQLGCTLFIRTNKGVRLTPEGELLYSHVAPAMEHIQRAEEALKMQKELRVSATLYVLRN